jgi:hypothetical protein
MKKRYNKYEKLIREKNNFKNKNNKLNIVNTNKKNNQFIFETRKTIYFVL